METKHTKGPWGWQDFGNGPALTAQHGMREIIMTTNPTGYSKGKLLMNNEGRLDLVNRDHPNAKLIASAPDLLEACLEAVSTIEMLIGDNLDASASMSLASIIKAIKKATE